MYVTMREGGIDTSIIHIFILIQEQFTLEQYYYIAIYRKQIPTVWLARE